MLLLAPWIVSLPACKSELTGVMQKRDGMCVATSLRSVQSSSRVKGEIRDCRDYSLDIRRFTPELEEAAAPEKVLADQCITIDDSLECTQVEESVFGTQRAMASDPGAAQHPESYRYTEFRASIRDSEGNYPIVVSSEKSLQEAVEGALKVCRERNEGK